MNTQPNRFFRRICILSVLGLAVTLMLATMSWSWVRPAAADSGPGYRANEILVRLNPSGGVTIATINASYGTTTLGQISKPPGTYRLQAPAGQDVKTLVATMAKDARLVYAQLNYVQGSPEDADPRSISAWGGFDSAPYTGQYALAKLGIPQAQLISQGEGVTVAIIDTGVELNHPVLSGTLTAARYDFIDNDNTPNDVGDGIDNNGNGVIDEAKGHGTHVAGIVHLVAPKAKIMPLRVLDSDGQGDEFSVGKAIEFANENGATIINLSLGSATRSKFIEEQIQDALDSGILVIAAAGNLNTSTMQYPAAGVCALAVASTGAGDVRSSFSNFGNWVDVTAPGEGIYSTFPISGFATWQGTSMAVPFVVGQAALIRSKNSTLKPRQVANLIASTADTLDTLNPTFAGMLGHGRINILRSLTQLAIETPLDNGTVLSTNCEEAEGTATPTPVTPTITPTVATTITPTPTMTLTPSPTATPTPTSTTSSLPNKLIANLGSMPASTLQGNWVIGSVSYVADANTVFDTTLGPFANGVCLGATYSVSNTALLLNSVATLESYKCQTTFQTFGPVDVLPVKALAASANVWRVGAITYTADLSTTTAEPNGKLAVGAFVELQYRIVNGTRVATLISTHIAPGQGPMNTTGLLTTRPSDDWGTWVIDDVSYLGDHAIQVQLQDTKMTLAAFAATNPNRVVQVNYYMSGSQRMITRVIELPRKVYLPLVRR